ncbi:MAG: DUF3576 domain-containing protein [Pseudomonadota bacterium]
MSATQRQGTVERSSSLRVLVPSIAIGLMLLLSACAGGSSSREIPKDQVSAIGVNGFLWRAALDTLTFLPVEQVDAKSGTIITDWYINPDAPAERLKVNVFITSQELRADALQVRVFRQARSDGRWVQVPVRAGTVEKLENVMLVRARELRVQSIRNS